ncbi:MgtC/SapB family protein [Acetobacter oeni]|uniref:Protein MgtC n=1 Tax=Acetobacter oeni TaxID=304077 RepID=A0A511XNR8_9PROT|nr:MgtC/SapB family protein [Acetobacter oeni]MBB3881538.1 putative Mg2+ transporter-C (MgtC) family protein [Acetobacter oeni]NHO18397.1 MgtC/SapB family protein [Acetobacter oeni]GBR10706.1 cation transporter MgtC/SapB [Acetobacter oeni LMG 21952]GEN64569.1 magnesium transporter [Acetobacter oeni]
MTMTLNWSDIVLRLIAALAVGIAFGLNRDQRGRPAGLRTTTLVCLAACLAMLQANWLLGTVGKRQDSFVTLDLMRLPLGILSGMGFIGGGAILRRENMVLGVTTAATLWIVTVIGLCFGGGQIILGVIGAVLGLAVLWGFSFIERALHEDQRAVIVVIADTKKPITEELISRCANASIQIAGQSVAYSEQGEKAEMHFELRWRGRRRTVWPPTFVAELARRPGVSALQWRPAGFIGM